MAASTSQNHDSGLGGGERDIERDGERDIERDGERVGERVGDGERARDGVWDGVAGGDAEDGRRARPRVMPPWISVFIVPWILLGTPGLLPRAAAIPPF